MSLHPRITAALAATAMAGTAFLVTPAGTGLASSAHGLSLVHFAGHHFASQVNQSHVFAAHFRASIRGADDQAAGRWA